MSGLLTVFGAGRQLAPISALFPSNAVFDLDATIASSFNGGQSWKNIVKNPADGAAGAAYNFNLGADASVSTDDPTFTGGAGNQAACFSFDGGDFFSLAGAVTNCPLLNTVQQKVAHGIVICGYFDFTGGGAQCFFTTCQNSLTSDVGLSYKVFTNYFSLRQRLLSSVITVNSATVAATAGNKIIIFSYDPATNAITHWVNTSVGVTTTVGYSATALNQAGQAPRIGATVVPGDPFVNGSKLYSFAMLNKTLSDADAAKIIGFYNRRHRRIYA